MIRNAVSKLRHFSSRAPVHWGQPTMLPFLKPLPQTGGLECCRYFSNLNGKKTVGPDTSKFNHEVKVIMPDISEGAGVKGTILRWFFQKGELIRKDDVICDIDTEMFRYGLTNEDDYDSIMGEIIVPENAEPVEAGTVICTIFSEGPGGDKSEKGGEEKEDK